jgi:phenylalanyl-tRNA synthetase beta chain
MFEIGSVFRKENEEQTNEIAGIISGLTHNKHWLEDNREVDVFDIKETLLELMKNIGAPAGQLRNGALEYYHPGRSGTVALGKFPIAYFGEIHPKVLEAFGIKQRVVAFELLLDNIPAPKKKKGTAKSKLDMSNLQATFRDFAFILDRDVPAEKLIQSVKKADKLITDVEIFDVYEGDNLGDNKKSLAIKVKIQPKEKTLTDKDLDLISSAIVLNVTKQTQGQLRN